MFPRRPFSFGLLPLLAAAALFSACSKHTPGVTATLTVSPASDTIGGLIIISGGTDQAGFQGQGSSKRWFGNQIFDSGAKLWAFEHKHAMP